MPKKGIHRQQLVRKHKVAVLQEVAELAAKEAEINERRTYCDRQRRINRHRGHAKGEQEVAVQRQMLATMERLVKTHVDIAAFPISDLIAGKVFNECACPRPIFILMCQWLVGLAHPSSCIAALVLPVICDNDHKDDNVEPSCRSP